MQKLFRYNTYIYIGINIFVGMDVFNRTKGNTKSFIIFMSLYILNIINNYIRYNYLYKDRNKLFLAIFIYIIISNLIIYNIGGYASVFNFMILYELILYTEGKCSRLFIGLTISTSLIVSIFTNLKLEEILSLTFWQDNLLNIGMMVLYLLFYVITLFFYKTIRMEKTKVDRLNKDLKLSYKTLLEQSKKIEALTITKERNRVAEEIHNELGHSLVALNMNLDVAEKIIDKDIIKTKELLNKSKVLTKKSMESLRKAVYELKEENSSLLVEKLKTIINNVQSTGKMEIIIDHDEKIEFLPLEYKNIIYYCIKEAITNSIRHGKADKINIHIKSDDTNINISIKDNGLGCSKLLKGNGLLGIEDRINQISGKVNYDITEDKGFNLEIEFCVT